MIYRLISSLLLLGASAAPGQSSPSELVRVPLLGVAEIDGEQRVQVVTWTYEKNGKVVESKVLPRQARWTRISTSVSGLMVHVPTEPIGIRIGHDLQRIFDEPILVDTDQLIRCSCNMREDCATGKKFHCEIEGYFERGREGKPG